MQHDADIPSWRSRATTQVLARLDLVGKVATKAPAFVTKILRADPPFAKQRFSRWFKDLRARAMQHDADIPSWRSRATTQVLARADLVGKVATKAPAFVTKILRADPPFAKQRFSRGGSRTDRDRRRGHRSIRSAR